MSKPELPEIQGCTDHSCVFGHPGGMGTNGGCRCIDIQDQTQRTRVKHNILALRKEIRFLREIAASQTSVAQDKPI